MKREAIAYHEAGHVVAAWWCKLPIRSASIVQDDESWGRVLLGGFPKWFHPDIATDLRHRDLCERRAIVFLAGAAAEARYRGRKQWWQGAGRDLRNAASILDYIVGGPDEADAYLNLVRVWATSLVSNQWSAIEAVAHELLKRNQLPRKEVIAIIRVSVEET